MTKLARILVAAASLTLIGMFVFPIWQIDLVAPQYPEGLGMQIRVNTIQGTGEFDLDNINKLNHYIGMKPIVPEAIPELKFMPWLVGALIVGGLAVAALGRRKPLWAWLGAFGTVALAGLVDFYRWGYDYGHDLDPEAILQIPGMSYQPPIIGTKQLLNFTATSWPALGGWLAFLALALGVVALVLSVRAGRATPRPAAARAAEARGMPLRDAVAGRCA